MANICNGIPKVAIIYFSLSPERQSKYKKVAESRNANLSLWKDLFNKTTKLIKNTGLPCFISDESTQTGNTFGQKLAHAIAIVFDAGYTQAIVIGNDCPELNHHHLMKSIRLLQSQPLIAGKDKNGGIYILGIDKNAFEATSFASLRWQTPHLLTDLKSYGILDSGFLSSILTDINATSDIPFIRFSDVLLAIRKLLFNILSRQIDVILYSACISQTIVHSHYNKGSPAAKSPYPILS